jgi:hypothetical protein
MITRVRKLTPMNVKALTATMLAASDSGTTFANLPGNPVQALAAVEKIMVSRPIDSTYRSLMAVRRKLALAASRWDAVKYDDGKELALTPYVTAVR